MASPVLQINPRERRLLGVLGSALAVALLFGLPFALEAVVRSGRAENDEMRQALVDVQDARVRVRERQAKKEAIAARYARRAPSLPGYLETAATQQKLEVSDSTPLPDIPHGKLYVEHGTDIHLKRAGLLPVVRFLESLEKSGLPVAATRLNLRKRSGESDSYDVEVGVSSYDRNEPASIAAPTGSVKP